MNYDDDGYAGQNLLNKIINFWKKFDETKLIDLVTDRWDNIDYSGGRSYLFTMSDIEPMLFEYLVKNSDSSFSEKFS